VLLGHKIGGDRIDSADAGGVLGGQRRDGGGAVRAQCRRGFEIGLDTGTARGIRAGNCQHDRRRAHATSLCASAVSTVSRNRWAAFSVFLAADMADTTAIPSAPASMTSRALCS